MFKIFENDRHTIRHDYFNHCFFLFYVVFTELLLCRGIHFHIEKKCPTKICQPSLYISNTEKL